MLWLIPASYSLTFLPCSVPSVGIKRNTEVCPRPVPPLPRYHQRICSIMCYPVCVLLYMLLPRKCTNFNKFCVIPIYKLYTPCVCGCVSGSFIIINSFINEISTHWMCLICMILSFFGKHAKPCCS